MNYFNFVLNLYEYDPGRNDMIGHSKAAYYGSPEKVQVNSKGGIDFLYF